MTVRASGVPDDPEYDRELGPIYGTFGDLAPIDRSDIALLAEHLTIVLGVRSGPAWSLTTEGWSARAEYRLFNPGPSAQVRFAVPLAWDQYALGSPFGRATSDPDDERSAEALLGASAIRLTIGGKTVPCELSWNATLSPNVVAAGLDNAFEGKCVAPLTIPSGESTLVLEYPAGFSMLAWQDSVRLRYALWPAGSWRGPVRELFVTVELGDQAPLAKVVSPPGAVLRDGRVEWKLRNVDLTRAGAIVIDLPPRKLGRDGWIRLEWSGAG